MIKPKNEEWIPWFIDIFTTYRDLLANFLKIHNIQTRPVYPEINKTPMYQDNYIFPISHKISETGLFLPSHTLLNDNEINYICNI
jgi:perosamine synthetase